MVAGRPGGKNAGKDKAAKKIKRHIVVEMRMRLILPSKKAIDKESIRSIAVNFLGDIILPLIFLLLILVTPTYFRELLSRSMPVRGLYQPFEGLPGTSKAFNWDGIVFFYLLPFLYGFFIAYRRCDAMKEGGMPAWNILLAGYIYSFLSILPLCIVFTWSELQTSSDFLTAVGCSIILLPCMIFLGLLTYSALSFSEYDLSVEELEPRKRYSAYLLLVMIVVGFVALKLYMLNFSYYPIGNDVYYHTALTLRIKEGFSPFSSPLMPGIPNYYPFLPHVLAAGISGITGVNPIRVWPYLDLVVQTIMLISLYLFAKEISGNEEAAVMSIIFFIPWDQFWLEHSSRHFALAVLPLFWLSLVRYMRTRGKKYIIVAVFSFLFMCACHHLVPLIALISGALYLFITYWQSRGRSLAGMARRKMQSFKELFQKPRNSAIFYNFKGRKIIALLSFFIISAILLWLFAFGFSKYSVTGMIWFGEMAISLNRPFGIISFALIPFGLAGLVSACRKEKNYRNMLVAISILFLSGVLYLTKIGILYPDLGLHHFRILCEVAMIPLSISAAMLLLAMCGNKAWWREGIILIIIIVILLSMISIYGKFRVQEWYGAEINKRMEKNEPLLNAISKLEPDSVILCDPDDMVNRYIPGVTGRLIYVARYKETEEGLAIVSPTIGFFSGDWKLLQRYEAARSYFSNPADLNLLWKLQDYAPITHVVLSSRNPAVGIFRENSRFREILSYDYYSLYEIVEKP